MYKKKLEELHILLDKKERMAVSTSLHNQVTARTLSTVLYQGKIYFQTDTNFITIKQLQENTNIALCIDNIQIVGTAKIIGPTRGQKELEIVYKEKHTNSYNSYSHLSTSIMVEITLNKVTMWVYRDTHAFLCYFDMKSNQYYEKQYI